MARASSFLDGTLTGCGPIERFLCTGKGGSYGNKILYKNLDLTQDFPNKISFHFLGRFLWEQKLVQKS